jgi:hypothetical protein
MTSGNRAIMLQLSGRAPEFCLVVILVGGVAVIS